MFRRLKKRGAVGIGTLIVFIAMVLVAAVAAAVLINTSGFLQQKASSTGRQTTQEVASGIQVERVVGYDPATPPASGKITKLAIYVSPNAGSTGIDLKKAKVILSDGNAQAIFQYDPSHKANVTAMIVDALSRAQNVTFTAGSNTIILLADADNGVDDGQGTPNGKVDFAIGIDSNADSTTDTYIVSSANADTNAELQLVWDSSNKKYNIKFVDGTGTPAAKWYIAKGTDGNYYIFVEVDGETNTDVESMPVNVADDGSNDIIAGYGNQIITASSANVEKLSVDSAHDSGVVNDIFGISLDAWSKLASKTEFGIIALQDSDGSIKENYPTLTKGDLAVLTVPVGGNFDAVTYDLGSEHYTIPDVQYDGTNYVFSGSTSASDQNANKVTLSPFKGVFGAGFAPRQKITGKVVPEFGSPGVIEFTTPTSFNSNIIELQ